jgi:hypothetical protein
MNTSHHFPRENYLNLLYLFYILAETSEIYWKSMTERRRQAIIETNIENQQVYSINIFDKLFTFF